MTERIGRDLFATVMRLPSQDRNDVLEYLGQSPVLPDAVSIVTKGRSKRATGAFLATPPMSEPSGPDESRP